MTNNNSNDYFPTYIKWLKRNIFESSRAALVMGLASVAASIASLIPLLRDINSTAAKEYLSKFSFYLTVTSAVIVITSIIIFFVLIIRRRTLVSSRLRKQVSEAFIAPLDRSSLNPSQKVDRLNVSSSN